MKLSRRQFLSAAGISTLSLPMMQRLRLGTAHAATTGANKLLTLYVPGGWMPALLFCPFSGPHVSSQVAALAYGQGTYVPTYYDNRNVLQPSSGRLGVEVAADIAKQPIRVPQLYNPANPTADAAGFNPNGSSWIVNELWRQTCVIHGVDQGTAAHESGRISMVSGAAGSDFRAPSMQAVVANALFAAYGDQRPLPSVTIGSTVPASNITLPAVASPTALASLGELRNTLSERNDGTWRGLRTRRERMVPTFDGTATQTLNLNDIDAYLLEETAALRNRSSSGSATFFERLFNSIATSSKTIAKDLLTTLEQTAGIGSLDLSVPLGGGTYMLDGGGTWQDRFELTMRLLRSNLCSSVLVQVPGPGNFFFDTHGETFENHVTKLYATHEVIGRFLGLMKTTPGANGGSLLDETLVVICSEFSRTFSNNDHWPTTSVVLVGGGVVGDTMLGNYALAGKGPLHDPLGVPVDLVEETGATNQRPPRSADVCASVYHAMGVEDFFIPGGYGRIVGVKA